MRKGDVGYLTIDESVATKGKPHRATRAKHERALHTEVGRAPGVIYQWGNGGGWGGNGGGWGGGGGWGHAPHRVVLERNVKILLANNLDDSCAVWDAEHEDTSIDGDIGHAADAYPYSDAIFMKAGEVHEIGILTPHESLPVRQSVNRQFLRIVGSGVHGREEYFTRNPLVSA